MTWWLMGSFDSWTAARYSPISTRRACRPRRAFSWDVTRVDRDWVVRSDEEGAEDEEEISRSRCSTPISSASSASIDVGT